MIGFASIAGGAPSSVKAMSDHLLNHTLPDKEMVLAAYYARGSARQEDITFVRCAQDVHAGEMYFSEALDVMMREYLRRGGDIDRIDDAEDRADRRLVDAIERIERGEPAAPPISAAVLRPDLHSLVARGLGIEINAELDQAQINGLIAGRRADGEKIDGKRYARERDYGVDPLTGERKISTPIGSYDFCPTPDKSVSVAWAFAPAAEKAMIYNAHLEASREAVAYIAGEIGRARFGPTGEESTPGHVAWLEFTHATSRRVVITMTDEDGVKHRLDSLPGDPDLHTHFLIPNAVFCEDGRIGSLDTKRIRGFIFEADAVYHALIGQKLRDIGFDVSVDQRTGAAKLTAVPNEINRLFSKRTNAGEELARVFTRSRDEKWEELSPQQQAARIKSATQSLDQKIKGEKDDVANFKDWRRQAKEAAAWEPASFMAYGPRAPELADEQRIRRAYEASHPFVSEKLDHRSVLSQWDIRAGAGKGLVSWGIKGVDDLGGVTSLMRTEGVTQYGERTPLIWAREDEGRVSITTGLHESQEREFIALTRAAAADRSGALPGSLLDRAICETGLDSAMNMARRSSPPCDVSAAKAAASVWSSASPAPARRLYCSR